MKKNEQDEEKRKTILMKAQKINNNGVHKKRYSKSNLNILPSFLSNKHILSKNPKIQKKIQKEHGWHFSSIKSPNSKSNRTKKGAIEER